FSKITENPMKMREIKRFSLTCVPAFDTVAVARDSAFFGKSARAPCAICCVLACRAWLWTSARDCSRGQMSFLANVLQESDG
ncbi:MAG: hypothetical protein VB091_11130, partial [Christensenella sp.]|nr:hypothetical protein [Christensenella sp.]